MCRVMIEACYNIDTSNNRIEVMKVELGAQLFLLVPPTNGGKIPCPLVGTMFDHEWQKTTNKRQVRRGLANGKRNAGF